jgi:transposase-like protein
MNAELTHFLGREPYVRVAEAVNHRNGSYGRGFALKGVGEVHVDVPRDRKGEIKTSVIPRSKQYEEEVARNVLAKVPKKFKRDVANALRSIFYAPSQEKAWECFELFRQRWQKSVPSALEPELVARNPLKVNIII